MSIKKVQIVSSTGEVLSTQKVEDEEVRNQRVFLNLLPKGAASHNNIFRGVDLIESGCFSNIDEICQSIYSGKFEDIYIGDYIKRDITVDGTAYPGKKFFMADFDTYLLKGDTSLTRHHAAIVPEGSVGSSYMNATNVTTGGYKGSYMHGTHIPKYVVGLKNAFGSAHVLAFRALLSNAVNTSAASMAGAGYTGASSGWEWTDVEAVLMSEPQIYGTTVFSSSFFDIGEANRQLSLFRLDPQQMSSSRTWVWLRAVASAASFAIAGDDGIAINNSASSVNGVRPLSLLG